MADILLMNHTLLGKKDWCTTAPVTMARGKDVTWKEQAYRDLVSYLCRYPAEYGPESQQGITFENQVYASTSKPREDLKGSDHFKDVVDSARGGIYQKFETKDMVLEDGTILRWYGILDIKFGDSITDIKTTKKYKGPEKFLTSGQDELYCWLTGIPKFKYVVAVWDEYPKIKEVHTIVAKDKDLEDLEDILKSKALVFLNWLKDIGLYDTYLECYSHKGRGWKTKLSRDEAVRNAHYKVYQDKHMHWLEEKEDVSEEPGF